MWGVPFEESMLNQNLIIHCPDRNLADELMEILARNGVVWNGNDSVATSNPRWDNYGKETCYWVERKRLSYGELSYAMDKSEYREHIKCTFYGEDAPTFEPANDTEMRGFLGF